MLRSSSSSLVRSAGRRGISNERILVLSRTTDRSFSTAINANDTTTAQQPKLVQVPTLPIFGSMIPWHSGMPSLDLDNIVNYWRDRHAEYGPFYSVGMPGIGQGSHGTLHVLRDPQEMLRVVKQEGKYPSGIVEREWPMVEYMNKHNYQTTGFMKRGEEWRRLRHFMQQDLLHPESAKEYLPGIIKGATFASQRVPEFEAAAGNGDKNYVRFLNYAAMDMFSEILFGGSSGDLWSQDEYEAFCVATVESLAVLFDLMRDPIQIAYHKIGYETSRLRYFYEQFEIAEDIATRRLQAFIERADRGELSGQEKDSYFYKMMQRMKDSNGEVTEREVIEMSMMVMIAAVDTTAAKTSWNLLQLAINPEIQEELYQQIRGAVDANGGELTGAVLDKSATPLLSAFIRETHRCTPAVFADLIKEVSSPTEVHGTQVPAGSMFMFDSITHMMDPELVEEPLEFRPQRWLKEQVQARKGTPQAIIDHPFYSGPFSQGARKCPGSRVANLEIQAVLSRLLLDYKIEGPSVHWKDVPGRLMTLYEPVFPKEMRLVPRNA